MDKINLFIIYIFGFLCTFLAGLSYTDFDDESAWKRVSKVFFLVGFSLIWPLVLGIRIIQKGIFE